MTHVLSALPVLHARLFCEGGILESLVSQEIDIKKKSPDLCFFLKENYYVCCFTTVAKEKEQKFPDI